MSALEQELLWTDTTTYTKHVVNKYTSFILQRL